MMKKLRVSALCAAILPLLTSCSSGPERWLRVGGTEPGGYLETAVGEFEDEQGRRVVLATESHIGEARYFDVVYGGLQGLEAVLFEAIANVPEGLSRDEATRAVLDLLQQRHASRPEPHPETGLVFSHHWKLGIANPVWSDVRGEDGSALSLDEERERMQEELGVPLAKRISGYRITLRTSLLESQKVLIDQRNDVVLDVLDEVLASGKERVGIIYGAAHGAGLAQGLRKRGFVLVDSEWLKAYGSPTQ